MLYEIKTDRLILRPLTALDLKTVHEYASDKDNALYMRWLPNETIEETMNFLAGVENEWSKSEPFSYEFAIVLDGVHIGAVSAVLDDKRQEAEIGWILNKKYWYKGYAHEAALAIKNFALRTLQVKKIIAICDYRNERSYHLMEKIGLKLENDNGIWEYPKRNESVRALIYSIVVE